LKDPFGIFSSNSDVYLNYQACRQSNANFIESSNNINFENNSNHSIAGNPFSDNLIGISAPLFHQTTHQNNFNSNNEQLNETYDNFKNFQHLAHHKDWKQMHSIGYFNSNDQCSIRFENVQNLNGPYLYQQQQQQQQMNPEIGMLIQANSYTSANLAKDEKELPRRAKKSRVLFSQWQINELEKLFKKQKYVTSNEREIVSKRLRLNPNQVKIWFQNRRYKIKKKSS
jgi:hypothetical protein